MDEYFKLYEIDWTQILTEKKYDSDDDIETIRICFCIKWVRFEIWIPFDDVNKRDQSFNKDNREVYRKILEQQKSLFK